jgi:di/tricarboxylate transporter
VIKMGIPLTIIIYIMTVVVELPWWYVTGLIK